MFKTIDDGVNSEKTPLSLQDELSFLQDQREEEVMYNLEHSFPWSELENARRTDSWSDHRGKESEFMGVPEPWSFTWC